MKFQQGLAPITIDTAIRWKMGLTAAWVAAGTCLYLMVPLTAPFVLPLAVAAPLLWSPREGLAHRLWSRPQVSLTLAAASVYLLINTIWSLTPVLAYRGLTTIVMAAIILHILARAMPLIEPPPARAMSIGFYGGYAASALFLSVEIIFDNPFHLYLYGLFPGLIPNQRGMVVAAGIVESLPESFLNHRMAALAFLIWPALLVASRLTSSARSRAMLVGCLSPAILAILASAHETSKVALVGGATALSIQIVAPRLVKPLLAAAWITACVAVVPVVSMAYDLELQRAEWLPLSARHRVIIWAVTSTKVGEAPIIGHGMGSARELDQRDREHPTYEPGTQLRRSTSLHAHNAFLQAWFETGAVGVALLCAIGLVSLGAISRVSADVQPALYAAFASNALIAATSFSLWAPWFLASHALTAIFAMLALSLVETAHAGSAGEV